MDLGSTHVNTTKETRYVTRKRIHIRTASIISMEPLMSVIRLSMALEAKVLLAKSRNTEDESKYSSIESQPATTMAVRPNVGRDCVIRI